MFCPKCGLQAGNEDQYCRSCGNNFSASEQSSTNTAGTKIPINNSLSGEETQSTDDQKISIFVGNNAQFYQKKWDHFTFPHKHAGWNWAAFFLGPVWLAFRKMHKTLLGYTFLVIMGFISISLLGTLNKVSKVSPEFVPLNIVAGILSFVTFFMPIIMGSCANSLYYKHVRRKVKEHELRYPSINETNKLRNILVREGGTSITSAIFIFVLYCILSFIWYRFDSLFHVH